MPTTQKIVPCLWFDDQAEQAVEFYARIFQRSRILSTSRYPEAGREIHGREPGSAMTVEFELDGQRFTALNGGPQFQFSEAISLQVGCETQQEVDYFWDRLSEGGTTQQCGWLKDRFGLSWQVFPNALPRMLEDGDAARRERVMTAMLRMTKIELPEFERAYAG